MRPLGTVRGVGLAGGPARADHPFLDVLLMYHGWMSTVVDLLSAQMGVAATSVGVKAADVVAKAMCFFLAVARTNTAAPSLLSLSDRSWTR
ncbi:uncharacterized protein BXZ73DRAFT_98944 [Epithele typhae]|uniref:uncharacterized protein n=1 Tax=Epithele typhae TaxID=378194 RepID=UPI0020072C7B|nr:uncharacterized protein BXZ73DRAFT_98944 [Epithele typhae]KAH9940515.1 hypothetical protein BXZ73DRAFT_98944 [Epithele typhae]